MLKRDDLTNFKEDMRNVEKILQSLTKVQKDELDKHLQEIETKLSTEDDFTPDKFGKVNANLRLDNDRLLLNMTVVFIPEPNGKLLKHIIKLIKFNSTDEYLDSINTSNKSGEGRTLKL